MILHTCSTKLNIRVKCKVWGIIYYMKATSMHSPSLQWHWQSALWPLQVGMHTLEAGGVFHAWKPTTWTSQWSGVIVAQKHPSLYTSLEDTPILVKPCITVACMMITSPQSCSFSIFCLTLSLSLSLCISSSIFIQFKTSFLLNYIA